MTTLHSHARAVLIGCTAIAMVALLGFFGHQPLISYPVVIVGSYLVVSLAHHKRREHLTIELTLEYVAIAVLVWFVLSSLL